MDVDARDFRSFLCGEEAGREPSDLVSPSGQAREDALDVDLGAAGARMLRVTLVQDEDA